MEEALNANKIQPIGEVSPNWQVIIPGFCGVAVKISGANLQFICSEVNIYDDGTTDTMKTYIFNAKSDAPPDIKIEEKGKEQIVTYKRDEILYRKIFNEIRNRYNKMKDARKNKGFIGENKILKVVGDHLTSIEKVMGKSKAEVSKAIKSRKKQKLGLPLT